MPAATGSKRVKNTRISRAFIIGSEAWPLDDTNRPPNVDPTHTKGWRVYVRAPEGQPDITSWLKKVSFKIFHTYENPTRTCESPPFQVEETGWGGFLVDIKLFFVSEASERPQARTHFLQLEPYGTEEQIAKQNEAKLVRSEVLDFIEFNEPTETLYDMLTDEAQFARKKGSGGRGKGKGGRGGAKAAAFGARGDAADDAEGTVELPEASTPSNPYSRETEQLLLELLKKAEADVAEMRAAETKKQKAAAERLAELRKTQPKVA